LIRMLLSCTLPLSIVDNNEFRRFCSSLDSRFRLPDSDIVRNIIINTYNRTEKLIQNKIIETAEFLAITLDIWTHSYFGVTCHWLTNDFKLIEVVLHVTNFMGTSELFKKLQCQLSKYKLTNENIISITTNNIENVIKESLSQMQIEIIPGFANILQVSVESVLSFANDIINKSKNLIEILSNNTNRQKLRDIQKQIDPNIKHHWMLLNAENENLKETMFSDDEFEICRELYIILNLFYELTEMLKGSKYPALSFVTPAIENLKQRLNIYQPKNDMIRQLINNILDILTNNFG
ncbi:22658_t:CDS:2, partial [Gigaspora margarita]